VRNLFRGEDAEDTAGTQVARAEQDKPPGNLTNSFQHSLGEGRRREEKAFSKAQVPHLTLFPLFSSPACCSLNCFPLVFYRSFLRPPRKFPQFLSLLIHPPLLSCFYLSKDRRDAMLPGRNSPWSCSAL